MKNIGKIILLVSASLVSYAGGCNWVEFGPDSEYSFRFVEVANGSPETILIRNSFKPELDMKDYFSDEAPENVNYPLRLTKLSPGESLVDTIFVYGKEIRLTDVIYSYIIRESTIEGLAAEGLVPSEYDAVIEMCMADYDPIEHKVVYDGK